MLLHTDAFAHTHTHSFYIEAFARKHFCTHTHAFIHRGFYTQTLLHSDAIAHRDASTHIRFYTQTLSHWRSYTPALLRTNAFTPNAFAHRNVETRTLWHNYMKLAQSIYFPVLLRTTRRAPSCCFLWGVPPISNKQVFGKIISLGHS